MTEPYIIVVISIVVFLVILILALRFRSAKKIEVVEHLEDELENDYDNVEYEWSARPSVIWRLLILMLLLAGNFFRVFLEDGNGELFEKLWQLPIFFGVFSALLVGVLKKYSYEITRTGLRRRDSGSNSKWEMLFTWEELLWIKLEHDGFRFYTGMGADTENREKNPLLSKSGRVYCGKQTTLVVSLVMSRGFPTSNPFA